MADPIPDDEPCRQCGLCCRILGPGIAPTPENVYAWILDGRIDILSWFVAFREDLPPALCTDLLAEDLGSVVFFEMRHPETGDYVTVCPFLKRIAKDRYICGIHRVKPEMCWNYQPWIWGETYFNKCKSLREMPHTPRQPQSGYAVLPERKDFVTTPPGQ